MSDTRRRGLPGALVTRRCRSCGTDRFVSGRRVRRSERGAVLVEAALIFPVLALIVFGALEGGLLLKDELTLLNVSRTGARTVSALANTSTADQATLQAAAAAAGALQNGLASLQKLVIFDATCAAPPCSSSASPISSVPSACLTASVSLQCNRYASADLSTTSLNLASNWGCGSTAKDKYWCPTSREIHQSAYNGGGTDYVGIYVEIQYVPVTGILGGTRALKDTVVFRIEPQAP